MKKADITIDNQHIFVKGDIDFTNVMSVYQQSMRKLKPLKQWHFDFSALKSSNSAGLALMVEWMKVARQQNKEIKFKNLSSDLNAIANLAGLTELFRVC